MKKLFSLVLFLTILNAALSQSPFFDTGKYAIPVTFTAQEASENMLQQLDIKKLRPGPSGDDTLVNAKLVGIEGVSRYGKAALVTLAFEQRFAIGLIGSSGKGGATLHHRVFGEAVESLAGGFHYWMAGNYMKYGAAEAKFASKTGCDLPVDAHQLIAMCAPRPTFISYGIPESGDAKWLDQQGSYMATVAAQPAFKLLGAKDLGVSNNYLTEQMPPVLTGLLNGHLAWRQHDGGHTDAPNFKCFIPWANTMLHYEKKPVQ